MYLIPQDKANHFIYGMLWSMGFYMLALLTPMSVTSAAWSAFCVAVIAGLVKEIKDYLDNKRAGKAVHSVEWLDIVATAAGGLPMLLTILALHFKG